MPVPPSSDVSGFSGILTWLEGAAGGALFGFVFSAILQRSKSARDELHIACDEFCEVSLAAADAGTSYWLKPADKANSGLTEAEAHLAGYQRRLSGYEALVRRGLHHEGGQDIEMPIMALFDALTGGDFRSPERKRDPIRAAAIQAHAADLVLAIRGSFIDKMDGRKIISRTWNTVIGRRGLLFYMSA